MSHASNHCNQKKEGPRSHNALNACTIPSALVFPDLLHEVYTSESHNTRLVPDSHRRPLQDQRCTNALLSHHYNTKFTQVPSKKILSLQAIYIARKHKHAPHQNAHKSANFQFCSLSLILLQQLGQSLSAVEKL